LLNRTTVHKKGLSKCYTYSLLLLLYLRTLTVLSTSTHHLPTTRLLDEQPEELRTIHFPFGIKKEEKGKREREEGKRKNAKGPKRKKKKQTEK
jgi:hypothetical protein